jgi:uncharacterized membrane protein
MLKKCKIQLFYRYKNKNLHQIIDIPIDFLLFKNHTVFARALRTLAKRASGGRRRGGRCVGVWGVCGVWGGGGGGVR